ncbi:MAG: hypothetical protein NW703_07405 [Nitrospiraceae bacterium]
MKPERRLSGSARGEPPTPQAGSWIPRAVFSIVVIGVAGVLTSQADASHQGHGSHAGEASRETTGAGHAIPGAAFQVFLRNDSTAADKAGLEPGQLDAAVQTVIDTLTYMMQHRPDFPRFDESVTRNLLEQVIVEPKVVNREGKEFPFLVARTKEPGRVNLLISVASLKDKGYLGRPEQLAPVLAREFQWVVSKADTAPKSTTVTLERDLQHAPIRTNREIGELSGEERAHLVQKLFGSYLTTVDDQKSLEGQPFYEVGTTTLVPPTQSDSTIKLYDIRVREALQAIVRDPYFEKHTPKAVRSLLNGKIWNVSFVKIDQRDWATRTRVLPDDQSVLVGERELPIQPAKILVNLHRTAAPDDPFYAETKGLPMGALSADQLAFVIAVEIQRNIVEKSMKGHVVQDEMTAP